jgi:hypothetical protein
MYHCNVVSVHWRRDDALIEDGMHLAILKNGTQ